MIDEPPKWFAVAFIGGRLDGQSPMVTVDQEGRLPREIRNELSSSPLIEVYVLRGEARTPDGRVDYADARYEVLATIP